MSSIFIVDVALANLANFLTYSLLMVVELTFKTCRRFGLAMSSYLTFYCELFFRLRSTMVLAHFDFENVD